MSRSEVRVTSTVAAARIELVDHDGRVVASGQGRLQRRVDPGLYTVRASVGTATTSEVIAARPGDVTTRHLDVDFGTVTPVRSTTTSHEDHGDPARALSLAPLATLGEGSRLVVFARVPSSDAALAAVDLDPPPLELLDDDLTPLDVPPWQLGPGAAGVALDLDPGTVVLRSHGADGAVDQSLVTAEGWTTLAFVPVWPEPDVPPSAWTPATDGTTVHMVRLGTPFEPVGPAADAVLATEIALKNLVAGDPGLSRELLRQLGGEFADPMLGIYGAHTLLAARRPQWTLAQHVIRQLRRLVPGHPDVDALHVRFKSARDTTSRSRVRPFRMPPMLHASYAAVIARDSVEHGLVEEGSIAEAAATELRPDGAWARWDALASPDGTGPRGIPTIDTPGLRAEVPSIDATLAEEAARAIAELLPTDQQPRPDGEAPVPVTGDSSRIAQYVTALAANERDRGDGGDLDISQLSRQMTLPVSTLRRELRAITDAARTGPV